MKLINADKYKKDIEHYRNTICYQRNVTMDDCMRILDKQEDELGKIREEIQENINYNRKMDYQGIVAGLLLALNIIESTRQKSGDKK